MGDAATLFERSPEEADSRLASFVASKATDMATDRIPGDAGTVSVETKGLVLDSDRLERQAEAVVAAADAFEEATVGASPGQTGT